MVRQRLLGAVEEVVLPAVVVLVEPAVVEVVEGSVVALVMRGLAAGAAPGEQQRDDRTAAARRAERFMGARVGPLRREGVYLLAAAG